MATTKTKPKPKPKPKAEPVETAESTDEAQPLGESRELYDTFRDGPASAADVAKATGGNEGDVQVTLDSMKRRQLLEDDEATSTDKTPQYRLSQLGRNQMAARYPA